MNSVYCGDFLTFDDQIQNRSVDLLLTDPPYNISEGRSTPVWVDKITGKNRNTIHNHNFSEMFSNQWDEWGHDEFVSALSVWSKFWFTKLRLGGSFAIFISDRYISFLWREMELAGFEPKRVFTWKKPSAVPFNRKVNPTSGCEYVLWGIKPGGKRTFNSSVPAGTLIDRFCLADKISSIVFRLIREGNKPEVALEKAKEEALKLIDSRKITNGLIECVVPNTLTYSGGSKTRIHPTQKPVEVLKFFIELLTNENDLVLDTFAGSGSTGIAAAELNRNSILIEKDPEMFQKMKSRFTLINQLQSSCDYAQL